MDDKKVEVLNTWILAARSTGQNQPIEADTELLDSGLLDSVQIIELVSFVEDHFNVKIDIADIVPENFGSIAKILTMIERL